jgi:hypothetical protein
MGAKKAVYEGLVLPTLLYGAESWCLTENLFNKLRRRFHTRWVRSVCRVNRHHTWMHHIRTADLLTRTKLLSMDAYVIETSTHMGRTRLENAVGEATPQDAHMLGTQSTTTWLLRVHIWA